MSLTQELIAVLKDKLLAEKTRITEELNIIAKPSSSGDLTTVFTEIGTDEDDNASEVEEYTDNLALENSLEKQLNEINEALERIEKGQYGKCENCSGDIPIDRLMAYPAAKTCIKC